MIQVRLNGGLGNQMFQYAAARRLAHSHHTDLQGVFEEGAASDTIRRYNLACFKLAPNFSVKVYGRAMTRIKRFFFGIPQDPPNLITEKSFRFDPTVLKLPDNVILQGYWQSEKYFNDVADVIRSEFEFKHPLTGKNALIAKQIEVSNSISIHIRRGDYAYDPKTNAFHGLIDLDYYRKALDYIESRNPNPKAFVFSDDIKWVKDNLKLSQATYIDWNQGDNSYFDMRLMSLCKHNIIANSSFSWWGAWLNKNPNKIVIAPKVWFKDSTINTQDLVLTSWVRM